MTINDLVDQGKIKAVSITTDEDGAVILELIFSTTRIGFNFELDEKESGWHVVSRNIAASGRLNEEIK